MLPVATHQSLGQQAVSEDGVRSDCCNPQATEDAVAASLRQRCSREDMLGSQHAVY